MNQMKKRRNMNFCLQELIIEISKNEIYWIKYSIIHLCTGKCKYKIQLRETNILLYPYIDISLEAYMDNLSSDIDHIFKNYIYINLNNICNEEQCYSENNKKYNQFISKIFKN